MTTNPVNELNGAPSALTFDMEEWFHAHALNVPRSKWGAIPSRLERPVDDILALLDEHDTNATFFVLGWVASRSPWIVERIQAAGHEIASHGYWHQSVHRQSRADFRADVRYSKMVLEEIIGQTVLGYRAPSYSINSETDWVFDELESLGFTYDSSIYPARALHGGYGVPGASPVPHRVRPGLWEFPLPTLKLLGRRFPAATGAYLRLAPMFVTQWTLAQNRRRSIPVVINIHTWELDPYQPRWPVPPAVGLRHYGNLRSTLGKLKRLLGAYRFAPLREIHQRYEPRSGSPGGGQAQDRVSTPTECADQPRAYQPAAEQPR